MEHLNIIAGGVALFGAVYALDTARMILRGPVGRQIGRRRVGMPFIDLIALAVLAAVLAGLLARPEAVRPLVEGVQALVRAAL